MKKSQIQKIIAEEIQSVLQERSKRAIEALMSKIKLARIGNAGGSRELNYLVLVLKQKIYQN